MKCEHGKPLLRSFSHRAFIAVLALLLLLPVQFAFAAKIGDITSTSFSDQLRRFFTLQDPSLRYALFGSILLGISCGLFGSFIVVRRMALVGDALSHAVLPGVAVGFLWHATKDPLTILIGATIAGLLGTLSINLITHYSRLKEDAAIGIVLASFFAVGITLLTMIQRLPTGNKSGINHYLFGQAAALSLADIQLMLIVALLAIFSVWLLYKEFLVVSFDADFARSIGFPAKLLHHLMMFLLAFAVVISLQAVGVVLVSAMLITPAAAAYLLTKRLHTMLILAAVIGMVSGVAGAFMSFLGNNLPTGPFMVLGATSIFAVLFFMSPRHGLIVKWWKLRSLVQRTRIENTLKAIYHVREQHNFTTGVTLEELAKQRRQDLKQTARDVQEIESMGFVSRSDDKNLVLLTPEGWLKACSIIRNHRLWELYLNIEKHIPADRVHEEAEEIEHVLGEETVRQLEKELHNPHLDPHGRPIPSLSDIWGDAPPPQIPIDTIGYARQR